MSLPAPTVSVSASAQREVPPDSFGLRATVSVQQGASADAARSLIDRYTALETAARALPDSVTITHGTVQNWSEGGKRPIWHADRTMTLHGTETDGLPDVVTAVGAVEDVSISGPYWEVDRDNPAHDELQGNTVHEARARAQRYATALGGTLGALAQLRDTGTHGWMGEGGAVAANAQAFRGESAPQWQEIDLSPQPLTLSATVEATWYLDLL